MGVEERQHIILPNFPKKERTQKIPHRLEKLGSNLMMMKNEFHTSGIKIILFSAQIRVHLY